MPMPKQPPEKRWSGPPSRTTPNKVYGTLEEAHEIAGRALGRTEAETNLIAVYRALGGANAFRSLAR